MDSATLERQMIAECYAMAKELGFHTDLQSTIATKLYDLAVSGYFLTRTQFYSFRQSTLQRIQTCVGALQGLYDGESAAVHAPTEALPSSQDTVTENPAKRARSYELTEAEEELGRRIAEIDPDGGYAVFFRGKEVAPVGSMCFRCGCTTAVQTRTGPQKLIYKCWLRSCANNTHQLCPSASVKSHRCVPKVGEACMWFCSRECLTTARRLIRATSTATDEDDGAGAESAEARASAGGGAGAGASTSASAGSGGGGGGGSGDGSMLI